MKPKTVDGRHVLVGPPSPWPPHNGSTKLSRGDHDDAMPSTKKLGINHATWRVIYLIKKKNIETQQHHHLHVSMPLLCYVYAYVITFFIKINHF